MKSFKLCFFFIFLFTTIIKSVYADRLKDMVSFAGIRSNQLMGYGIVVGLDGTGDSSLAVTLQSMQSTISQFGMNVDASSLSGKNSAAVMITADLDPFTKVGQKIGVTVSSMGKAKSLRGGTLLMTPLKGADGKTYAIAQGNLAVGGFGVEGADGSSMSVNIPTVGILTDMEDPSAPSTPKPPTARLPCAIAYVLPSAPFNGVIKRVPPLKLFAFPIEETVTPIF